MYMKRLITFLLVVLAALSCSPDSHSEGKQPDNSTEDRPYRLTVDGKPFLMIGAQLRTDFFRQLDGRELDNLDDYFSLAAGLNITCVQVPVSWSDVETAYDEYTDKYIFFRDGKTVVSTTKPLVARIPSMFISIIIGVVASLLFYFITKSNYKFKASCNPHVYVAGEQTQFTAKEDRYIRTATTRTKIESSSGGGRSGGGRSGGGSRGGGGRRR